MLKRILGLLAIVLFMAPLMTRAQAQANIDLEEVAESVVNIVPLQRGQPVGTESGTIIEPNGIIYTNRHVVEIGDDYAIYMLDDIGDPPELRYYASLIGVSDAIDFALLQIDRDANGRQLDPDSLSLNTVPLADNPIEVGDTIRIFGFPGISEGLLTVTSGEVVTVQNGSMYGERLPVWYWTDAEISSGNSGGLTINSDGEFVGIPTWVRAEARTAGRFGGVLPYRAILTELGTADRAPSREDEPTMPTTQATELILENFDDVSVCYVYISSPSDETWGDDELSDSEIIERGDTRTFDVEPGFYDVLLQDCDNEVLNDLRNVDLTESVILTHSDFLESTLSRLPEDLPQQRAQASKQVTVTLQNQDDISICYVYISPTTAMQWGEDQLGDQQVIEPGNTAAFTLDPGIYDILLEDCNHAFIDEAYELDLTQDTALIQEPG